MMKSLREKIYSLKEIIVYEKILKSLQYPETYDQVVLQITAIVMDIDNQINRSVDLEIQER